MKLIVYATGNPGKTAEISRRAALHGLPLTPLTELLEQPLAVEETGKTLGENALLKVQAHLDAFAQNASLRGKRIYVAADDTGIEIKGLGGEPGIFVRRWKDRNREMTDAELTDYALERTRHLRGAERDAVFLTTVAVGILNEDGTAKPRIVQYHGKLHGSLYHQPQAAKMKGFPFASLFHVSEWGMCLAEGHGLSDEERTRLHMADHREKAFDTAMRGIKRMMLY